jgi:glutaconate CoA-transferase subunit B
VISPLGSFDFTDTTHELRLRTLHPGVTVEQVQERTGFPVHLPKGPVPTTPAPSEAELTVLRTRVDRTRVLA